jgi:molybdopterin synthase sulfurtransferase
MVKNKMNAILFMIIMILAVFTASACSSNTDEEVKQSNETSDTVNTITTEDLKKNLNDDSWVVVDTRINDAFNGWKLDGVARSGHIEGAVDFSANWLKVDVKEKEKKLDETLEIKGISPDKNIVLYDANGTDAKEMEKYLSEKGYKNLYTYDVNQWAEDESLPMVQYKNYQRIVPASVVKEVLDGKTPETFEEGKKVKIV